MLVWSIAGAVTVGLALGICVGLGLQRKQDLEAEEFVENLRDENAIEMLDISSDWPEASMPIVETADIPVVQTFEEKMAQSESPEEDEDEEEAEDVAEVTDEEKAEELMLKHRYNMKHAGEPYIIDESFYFAQDAGYGQETLTWSAGEMLLRDENEQVIMDIARYIGYDALEHFGEGSSDPNSVYVRNDRLMTDYEVVREE